MKSGEIGAGLALGLFGAGVAVLSLQLPLGTLRAAGPGFFPLCLGLALVALSGIFVLQAWPRREAPAAEIRPVGEAAADTRRMLCFLGLLVLAPFLLDKLGYLVTAFLLMFGLLWILGMKRPVRNAVFSLAVAVAAHLFFVVWLKIPLPRSGLGF